MNIDDKNATVYAGAIDEPVREPVQEPVAQTVDEVVEEIVKPVRSAFDDDNATVYAGEMVDHSEKRFDYQEEPEVQKPAGSDVDSARLDKEVDIDGDMQITMIGGSFDRPTVPEEDESLDITYVDSVEDISSKYAPKDEEEEVKDEADQVDTADSDEPVIEPVQVAANNPVDVADDTDIVQEMSAVEEQPVNDDTPVIKNNPAIAKPDKENNKRSLIIIGAAAIAIVLILVLVLASKLVKTDKSTDSEDTTAIATEEPSETDTAKAVPDYDKSALKKAADPGAKIEVPLSDTGEVTEVAPTDALGELIDEGWSVVEELPEVLDPGESLDVDLVNDTGEKISTEIINPFDTPVDPVDAIIGSAEIDITDETIADIVGADSEEVKAIVDMLPTDLINPDVLETTLKIAGIDYEREADDFEIHLVEDSSSYLGITFEDKKISGISVNAISEILDYFK